MAIKKKVKTNTTPPKSKKEEPSKSVRAPKQKYGYASGAEISLGEEKSYRSKRGKVYAVLVACDGKTVEDFAKKAVKVLNENESPRGWLQFFVRDDACTLSGGAEA